MVCYERFSLGAVQMQHESVGEFELCLGNNTLWLGLVFACKRGEGCRHFAADSCGDVQMNSFFCGSIQLDGATAGNYVSA